MKPDKLTVEQQRAAAHERLTIKLRQAKNILWGYLFIIMGVLLGTIIADILVGLRNYRSVIEWIIAGLLGGLLILICWHQRLMASANIETRQLGLGR